MTIAAASITGVASCARLYPAEAITTSSLSVLSLVSE